MVPLYESELGMVKSRIYGKKKLVEEFP